MNKQHAETQDDHNIGVQSYRSLRLRRIALNKASIKQGTGNSADVPDSHTPAGTSLSLSAFLKQAPGQCDSVKISAVERFITEVDVLPERYKQAQIIYLSKNSLRSLQGVQQFQNLHVLSAADNLLQDFSELDCLLGSCPALEVASFEGNPLACLPNYRAHVIAKLGTLKCLDGRNITAEERQRSVQTIQQEASCMAVMLSNACLVHKLVSCNWWPCEIWQSRAEVR